MSEVFVPYDPEIHPQFAEDVNRFHLKLPSLKIT